MQIHTLASRSLKYMMEFKSTCTVDGLALELGIDNENSTAVLKYILRRRNSWFATLTDHRGETCFVIRPVYISEIVKFLDMGGFR